MPSLAQSLARTLPGALLGVLAAGCGASATVTDGGTDSAVAAADMATRGPDMAAPAKPITAAMNTWTFVPIDGMVCDDGSATGIGVYLTGSPNLVIFLNGGGACWDYSTCFQLNTSTHGPFGQAQFDALAAGVAVNNDTVLSEGAINPFKGWNKVFVPYCTGDIHAGNAVKTFMGAAGMSGTVHFQGWQNAYLALSRLGATIPSPTKMVFSGSSAGGYGATVNYIQARQTWPAAKSYLIDDSGPVFIDGAITDFLKSGWIDSWNLAGTFFQWCPDCNATDDWSLGYSLLSKTFPNDRLALLETQQDQTISGYLLLPAAQFQADLTDLGTTRLDPLPNFKYFFEPGKVHTMLGALSMHTSNGVNVATWLGKMVGDDPSWSSVKP